MDSATQATAGMVKEETAACRLLTTATVTQEGQVNRFRVDALERAAPAPERVVAARPAPRPAARAVTRAMPAVRGNLALKVEAADDWVAF